MAQLRAIPESDVYWPVRHCDRLGAVGL